MDLQQFNTLSKSRKVRNLLINGSCIGERKIEDAQVLLFQLYSFYVEVFLNYEGDEVLHSRSFEDIEELRPYLEQVNLSSLYQ
jgi:hypothetical protein